MPDERSALDPSRKETPMGPRTKSLGGDAFAVRRGDGAWEVIRPELHTRLRNGRPDPERKEPWARKARVQFDAGNYAQAITSAEEVLQRDPADRTAKSIRAVAGLRVATQSLNELRSDVELKGNARTDAIGLVKVMRETLGESVLVPPSASKAEAVGSRNAAATQRASQGRGRAGSRKPAAPAAAEAAPSGGDPFGALK